MRALLHQLANTAAFRPLATRTEDAWKWLRAGGTPQKFSALRADLARCREFSDYFAFAGRFFSPCQIPSEIQGLLRLLASEKVRRVGEIGTARSGTQFLLMHAVPAIELSVAIDLQIRHLSFLRNLAPAGTEFLAFNGSSYAPATVRRVATALRGRKLDFLLIDGDHRYEGVKADYLAYRDHVKLGGLIAFHDIKPAGGDQQDSLSERWAGGVPRLWQEIKARHTATWEFVDDPNQAGFGLGVLRHGSERAG